MPNRDLHRVVQYLPDRRYLQLDRCYLAMPDSIAKKRLENGCQGNELPEEFDLSLSTL